jgi:hypothetical protein
MIKFYKASIPLLFSVLIALAIFFIFQSQFFQTQTKVKLSIPDQSVPFIEIRTSQSEQAFVQLYLCVWDPASAAWFRDDIPICEIQGGPIRVFWNGTRRVFLSPSNPRGSFRIIKQNPVFQVISLPSSDSFIPLYFADQHDLPYFFVLEQHQQNKELRVSMFSDHKVPRIKKVFELEPLDPSFSLDPIGYELSKEDAKFFFSFKRHKEVGSSHGVVESQINFKSRQIARFKKRYESFYADPRIYYQKTASDLFRIRADGEISIMQNEELGFLPFTINRSNLLSFHDYVFEKKHPENSLPQLEFEMKELPSNDIRISQFDQIMLILWKPYNTILSSSSTETPAGTSLEIAQISAIHNGKMAGRIERIGQLLRFYSENRLQQELSFPDDGFKYEYLCP